MKILFSLAWQKKGNSAAKLFKRQDLASVYEDYLGRIRKLMPVETISALPQPLPAGSQLWLCDANRGKKMLSSEEIAQNLQSAMNSSTRQIYVAVGGPNGFEAEWIEKNRPSLILSFGRITLPHELAALIASEQVYRAFSILNNLPYHSGH